MLAKLRSLLTRLLGGRDRIRRPTGVPPNSTSPTTAAPAKATLASSPAAPAKTVPQPKVGDKVYVPGFLHVTHGADDFEGGLVTVGKVRVDTIKGQNVAFVYIEEDESWVNWDTFLAPMQDELRSHFGTKRGKPKPDRRPEFNE